MHGVCDFCSTVNVRSISATCKVPNTIPDGFIQHWRDQSEYAASSDFEGPTIDHILQNKASCSLCNLIYEGFKQEGLDVLLSKNAVLTRSRTVSLRLVNASGFPSRDCSRLAGIRFKLQSPPNITTTSDGALYFGSRFLPTAGKRLRRAMSVDCTNAEDRSQTATSVLILDVLLSSSTPRR